MREGRLPVGSNIPLPVAWQVLAGVGSLSVLLVASSLLAIFVVRDLSHESSALSAKQVPYASAVEAAALAAKGSANDSRGFLMSGNELFIERFARHVAQAREAFDEAAAREPAGGTAAIRRQFERWVGAARSEFRDFVAGRRAAATAASLGPDRLLRRRYEIALTHAGERAQEAIRAREATYAGTSRHAMLLLLGCLLASLAFALAVTIWLVRRILGPVYTVLHLFGSLRAPAAEGRTE
jgi:methyl-accepting chemotaxis protein